MARALLPVLKQEEEHIQRREVIRRNRESEVRATCGKLPSVVKQGLLLNALFDVT